MDQHREGEPENLASGTPSAREPVAPRVLTRRDFLAASAGAGLFVLGLGNGGFVNEAGASPLSLEIFKGGYPRAFFFRQVEREASAGKLSYAEWEKRYLPLGGIMGKVLNEVFDFSRRNNLAFFQKYKARNPGKAVFLHYDGAGRRPADEATTRFFAGHWLYYKGTTLTQPVTSSRSATALRVADTSVFRLERIRGTADHIVIVPVDRTGKRLWANAEQVKLKNISAANKTISVQRGAYGTRIRSFPKGTYLAAHVMTGPFDYPGGPPGGPIWHYNYSTVGPRDAQGRNGGQALADYLTQKFRSGGALASFDGICLDVLMFSTRCPQPEDVDTNADGRADAGLIDGINVVGRGKLEFTKLLRQRLPSKIILADGAMPQESQRSFGQLNGVETEGYPNVHDIWLEGISSGENTFNFWKENSAAPSINTLQYKYIDTNAQNRNEFIEPSLSKDHSYRKLRLVLASAQFTDAVFEHRGGDGYVGPWGPPPTPWRERGVDVHVFDEMWRGVDQETNWLGLPQGPATYLAGGAPDLLRGLGETWPSTFVGRFTGSGVAFSRPLSGTPTMAVKSTRSYGDVPVLKRLMAFKLPGINVPQRDLFVSLQVRAGALVGYPTSVARRVNVTVAPAGSRPTKTSFTWAGGEWFTANFFFADVGPRLVDLGFQVEGDQPVYFGALAAHSAPGAVYRKFENGAVFANLSSRPYTFDLSRLLPDASYRRIRGTGLQDPDTNNGQDIGETLTIGPKDALFVIKNGA